MLTIRFVPYAEIENLNSDKRIHKLLSIAKENKIALLEGRLRKEEEAELIKNTMKEINAKFKGIELAVIYPDPGVKDDILKKLKSKVISILLGNREGFTVIGPATIVKEIKKDPHNIQLLTRDIKKKKKRKK